MSEERPERGTMLGDLGVLLQSGAGADMTLVAAGGSSQLLAHSHILAARSPVFAAAMRRDVQETWSHRTEITDVPEEALRQLLLFMYTDDTPQLAAVAKELLVAADKYDLPLLKKRCEQQMLRDLSVENAATAAAVAALHCCPRLHSAAVSFMVSHPTVIGTASWAQLLRGHVETAVEVCRQLAAAALQPATLSTVPELVSSETRSLSGEKGKTLIEAAKKGALEEVQKLLETGAWVEARDEYQHTSLHWAASKGHVEVVKCLLSQGAVVDSRNIKHSTPLHLAAQHGHTAVVRLLVVSSAYHSARNQYGITPLHCAARGGHLEATTALLELGADKEARTNWGQTPLSLAAQKKRQQVIHMLK